MQKTKNFLIALFIFIFACPLFCSAETKQPQDMDEAINVSQQILENTEKEMPGLVQRLWQNEVLPVWRKMFDWTKTNIWENKLSAWFENFWQTTKNVFKTEVDQRKPTVEKEFQKEKQDLKNEAPLVGQNLWQKFQELIK